MNNYISTKTAKSLGINLIGKMISFILFGVLFLTVTMINVRGQSADSFNPNVVGSSDPNVKVMTVQPDGKILIGGMFATVGGQTRISLARVNSDGTLDPAFNPMLGSGSIVYSIVLQTDGKILIGGFVGSFSGQTRKGIARLNSDGTLDPTFDANLQTSSEIRTIAIQPDGRILAGGKSLSNTNSQIYLVRLNLNGTQDTSFNVLVAGGSIVHAVKILPNGKILVAGEGIFYNESNINISRNLIALLNNNGTIDTSFNADLRYLFSYYVLSLAVEPNGKFFVGGYFLENSSNPQGELSKLWRLNLDGSRDTTFNINLSFTNGTLYSGIALQNDGKIIATVNSPYIVNGETRRNLARLNPDGTLDAGFRADTDSSVLSVVIQPDNKILVGGYFNNIAGQNRSRIARLSVGTSQNTPKKFDFDGDGKADVSVFRPSNGAWYLQQSQAGFTGFTFGFGTDKLVPADYDGDGKTDVAVYRGGTWYLQRSQLGFTGVAFGDSNDIPVPADYDGDGKADLAVFRPSNGTWYLLQSTAGFTGISFGQNGDKPVAADYDGDGKTDVAVNRNGIWYIQRSQLGFYGVQFGDSNDKLVPADYDGDGKVDVAVFRPSNGVWYLQQSTNGFTGIAFGLGTDTPVAADYDGDGKADVAVFRNGTWYLQRSSQGFTGVAFGTATDLTIPNAFVR